MTPPAERGAGLVAAQLALLAGVAAATRRAGPAPRPLRVAGAAIAAAGAALAVAGAAPLGRHLRPWVAPAAGARLVERGAFRLVRHPVYAGLVLLAGGRSLACGSRAGLLLTAALSAVLRAKAVREERVLARRFPAYAGYRRRTRGRLLPRR